MLLITKNMMTTMSVKTKEIPSDLRAAMFVVVVVVREFSMSYCYMVQWCDMILRYDPTSLMTINLSTR